MLQNKFFFVFVTKILVFMSSVASTSTSDLSPNFSHVGNTWYYQFIVCFQQRNLKQKFAALLRRFKVSDEVSFVAYKTMRM